MWRGGEGGDATGRAGGRRRTGRRERGRQAGREEGGRDGCSAAVERSEQRLQSLPMGGIRLWYHSSEALRLSHFTIIGWASGSEGGIHI